MARQAATLVVQTAATGSQGGHVAGVERQAATLLKPQPAHMSCCHREVLPSCNRCPSHPLPAEFVTSLATPHLFTRVCAVVAARRYLMSTDGWSATSKLDKYLLLGSVVLKQESPKYGWFYKALQPMENYVPFFKEAPDDVLKVCVQWPW